MNLLKLALAFSPSFFCPSRTWAGACGAGRLAGRDGGAIGSGLVVGFFAIAARMSGSKAIGGAICGRSACANNNHLRRNRLRYTPGKEQKCRPGRCQPGYKARTAARLADAATMDIGRSIDRR